MSSRAHIAGDVDPVNIDARSLANAVGQVNGALVTVTGHVGTHVNKGIAGITQRIGQRLHRFFDRVGVVPVLRLGRDQILKPGSRDLLQVALDRDRSETVALPLLDHEGDDEGVLFRCQFRHRRLDAEIGIAMGQIELAQKLAVEVQPVRIVGVVRREELVPAAFLGTDHVTQRRIAEALVADEGNLLDSGPRSFRDLEHQIDAVLLKLDDLRLHLGGETAAAAVDLQQALDIFLNPRAGIDTARSKLYLAAQILVVEDVVTLEVDTVDHGVFYHLHDHPVAFDIDGDVGKQAGGEQFLQGTVQRNRIHAVAPTHEKVGPYGLRLDALIADDLDFSDRAPFVLDSLRVR